MEEEKIKHLEFIQSIIARMNTNSFQIRKWTVVLVTVILALYASTKNNYLILLGALPAALSWFLDAHYLTQERKFRGLYNDVAGIKENHKEIKLFEMRLNLYVGGEYAYWDVFHSPTLERFYASIVVLLGCLYLYLRLS